MHPEEISGTLKSAWKRLRETRGSTLRRLSNVPGREFRLRLGDIRVVFTTADLDDQRLGAFVHLVAHRGSIYDRGPFFSRVALFHNEIRPAVVGMTAAGQLPAYAPITVSGGDDEEAAIEFSLFEPQQRFFDRVLSFTAGTNRREPRLVIGQGPPGAGKTIVGQELMREALSLGYQVDVLVPSQKLARTYRKYAMVADALLEDDEWFTQDTVASDRSKDFLAGEFEELLSVIAAHRANFWTG